MPLLTDLLDGALSLLFPPRCETCGTLQEPVVCARCREEFVRIRAPFCLQCGLPFDPRAHALDHCADCRDDPPPFDAARAAGLFQGRLRTAIHGFKYDGARALAAPLAELMAETITLPFPVDALAPVPLHPDRERMRGYNQSRLLADELGARWNLPVTDVMTRVRNIPPQMTLPADERRRNVRGAFAADAVAGRVLGLVDDVYTTGATLRECSRVLKRAGAARVCVLTVARATGESIV
jgi:ComF family protein